MSDKRGFEEVVITLLEGIEDSLKRIADLMEQRQTMEVADERFVEAGNEVGAGRGELRTLDDA